MVTSTDETPGSGRRRRFRPAGFRANHHGCASENQLHAILSRQAVPSAETDPDGKEDSSNLTYLIHFNKISKKLAEKEAHQGNGCDSCSKLQAASLQSAGVADARKTGYRQSFLKVVTLVAIWQDRE